MNGMAYDRAGNRIATDNTRRTWTFSGGTDTTSADMAVQYRDESRSYYSANGRLIE